MSLFKKFEFSKIIIAIITFTYFVGLIVGAITVLEDPEQLNTLLVYIGGVVGITIPFYVWKAKSENVLKIQQDNQCKCNITNEPDNHEVNEIIRKEENIDDN